MTINFSIIALIFAFWAAFQMQIITFFPNMGLWTVHKFEPKRWFLRLVSVSSLVYLWLGLSPNITRVWFTGFACFFLFVSFVIDNTKGFRALDPQFVKHNSNSSLADETIVVGVELNADISIYYPIEQIVIPLHLINDEINNIPLLVSFCAACRSCMVYDPVVDGQRLTFQVVAVWRRNMIIRDVQTGTLWQQATGEALYGALKGAQMQYLGAEQMSKANWLVAHPTSLHGVEAPNAPKGRIPTHILHRMLKITNKFTAKGFTDIGSELPLRENIFGITINGVSKAYPVSELLKTNEFDDTVGGHLLHIAYNPKTTALKIINQADDKPILTQNHWWFGWKEFHPYSEIWRA